MFPKNIWNAGFCNSGKDICLKYFFICNRDFNICTNFQFYTNFCKTKISLFCLWYSYVMHCQFKIHSQEGWLIFVTWFLKGVSISQKCGNDSSIHNCYVMLYVVGENSTAYYNTCNFFLMKHHYVLYLLKKQNILDNIICMYL